MEQYDTDELKLVANVEQRTIKIKDMSNEEITKALKHLQTYALTQEERAAFREASLKWLFARKEIEEELENWLEDIQEEMITKWVQAMEIVREEGNNLIKRYEGKLNEK